MARRKRDGRYGIVSPFSYLAPGSVARSTAIPLLLLVAACSTGRVPPRPEPAAVAAAPKHLRWFSESAEHPALTLQVYRAATKAVMEQARLLPAGSWAVILDADETVIDNSEHERRVTAAGLPFSDSTWVEWARERAAPAIPGAVAFIQAVQSAGGRIAIVTNRADSLCADTRANLDAIGVRDVMMLCKTTTSDKNPRFRMVLDGSAPGAGRPLTVVAWVGDNIRDFPGLSQESRGDAALMEPFGSRWFILPNPMYGSWER